MAKRTEQTSTRAEATLATSHRSRPLRNVSLWAVPFALVMIVMSVLASLYLGGSINPSDNLDGFPIAVVDEDAGTTLPNGQPLEAGSSIADGIVAGIDPDKFNVAELTRDEAEDRMREGTLYGAIVIGPDFSAQLAAFGSSAVAVDLADRPVITVLTDPRSGTGTPQIVTAVATAALASVNESTGQSLTQMVQGQLTAAGTSDTLTGAAASALAAPIDVQIEAYDPLPAGTGSGLAAFYFALLIILAGFTGSMIVSTFVDQTLGFAVSEIGPRYVLQPHSGLSRVAVLVVKWVLMGVLALAVSGAYVGIASALGMPIDRPLQLWGLSALGIVAVALVAQTVTAIFGGLGLLINLFIFVILALPSAGGTVPLEATPPLFRFLGSFEPMHQLYLGVRSVLYYGGTWESGLGRAVIFSVVTGVVGLIVGLIVTRFFDRAGLHRRTDVALASEPALVPTP